MSTATAEDVAKWMLHELNRVTYLYQETVVLEVIHRFGEEFAYLNDNGNYAIDKKVLSRFRKLTGDNVIWERGSRMWRVREPHDDPGRQQY